MTNYVDLSRYNYYDNLIRLYMHYNILLIITLIMSYSRAYYFHSTTASYAFKNPLLHWGKQLLTNITV